MLFYVGTPINSIPCLFCLYTASASEQALLPLSLVYQRDLSGAMLVTLPTIPVILFSCFAHCAHAQIERMSAR